MASHNPSSNARIRSRSYTLALLVLTATAPTAFAQTTPSAPTPAAEATTSKIPVLTRAQIDADLAQPDKVLFIDVRRPDEISEIGGFPAYLSIQISELDRFVAVIPKDRAVVVVSNHAARGQKGAELLAAKGFNVVGAIGAQNYEKEGGALWDKKVVTPDIPGVVKGGTLVSVVREGFNGSEGPAVLQDGSILFTEQRTDRIIKIGTDGKASTFLEDDGGAHRLALTPSGELVAAETGAGHVGITVLQPTKHVIATGLNKDTPFIHPNDLAISSTGNIYVTDPGAYQQAVRGGAKPIGPIKTGFYWINRKGKVALVTDEIPWPNGVVLSPDEKTVYVANTVGDNLIAFSVNADGSLGNRRDFAKLVGFKQTPQGGRGADGIAIDIAGRVYAATSAGIEVFDASGTTLGVIPVPRQPQALVFGGPDRSRLYVVGRGSVYRIATLTKGPDRIGR